MDYYSIDTYRIQLKILNEIVRLSKIKKLVWKKDKSDFYNAKFKGLELKLELYNFRRMDEKSSDDTIASLSIITSTKEKKDRLSFDYSIGTEGFELIMKSLSYSFETRSDSWERVAVKRKARILEYISNL